MQRPQPLNLPPMRAVLRGVLNVDPAERRLLLHVATIYATEETAILGIAMANSARWFLARRAARDVD